MAVQSHRLPGFTVLNTIIVPTPPSLVVAVAVVWGCLEPVFRAEAALLAMVAPGLVLAVAVVAPGLVLAVAVVAPGLVLAVFHYSFVISYFEI